MIKVILKTNTTRKQVMANVEDTPKKILEDSGIGMNGMININGANLSAGDLSQSFSDLGYNDDDTLNLTSIVKADGASR